MAQKILLVEDDPDGQEVLQWVLQHHHIETDVVGTGEDALALLAADSGYTVAIVDLALPGMDGFTLLNELRQRQGTARVPCIAVTAYHSAELAVQAVNAGFAAYFPKPIDTALIIQELQRYLG
jgi:CheY-like chemotaxis protein